MRELERAVERAKTVCESRDDAWPIFYDTDGVTPYFTIGHLRTLLSALDGYRKDELLSHMVAQCEEDYAAGWMQDWPWMVWRGFANGKRLHLKALAERIGAFPYSQDDWLTLEQAAEVFSSEAGPLPLPPPPKDDRHGD